MIKIWNSETGNEEMNIPGHTDAVTSARISPDNNYIASSSAD